MYDSVPEGEFGDVNFDLGDFDADSDEFGYDPDDDFGDGTDDGFGDDTDKIKI